MIMLVLIVLHSGSGTPLELNPALVTNLRNPEPSNGAFSKGVHCQVNMVDGKFVTVIESCREVLNIMGNRKSKR